MKDRHIRDKKGRFVKGHKFLGITPVIIWKYCLECQKRFYVTSKDSNYVKKRFCSKICGFKHKNKTLRKGKYYPCKTCGITVYVGLVKRFDRDHFCSKKCFYKFRKGWSNEKMREALAKGRKNQKGKPKSNSMKRKMSETYKRKWANLKDREIMMRDRTPEKLKKFREGHKNYLKDNKGNLPILKNNRRRKVIDLIIQNGNH